MIVFVEKITNSTKNKQKIEIKVNTDIRMKYKKVAYYNWSYIQPHLSIKSCQW